MATLPSPRRSWFELWGPFITIAAAAVVSGIGAVVAFVRALRTPSERSDLVLVILIAVVLFVTFVRESVQLWLAFKAARRQRLSEEAHELQAVGQVLREQLAKWHNALHDATAFRVCVYRVCPPSEDETPSMLERVTRYAVGADGDPGDSGKRVSSACGVIGLAYRTGDPQVATRVSEDTEGFRKEMVEQWGFSQEEVKSLNESRWSFLAFPIRTAEGKVDAVVFADSSTRDAFSEEVVSDLVVPACEATKMIIERRYGRGE